MLVVIEKESCEVDFLTKALINSFLAGYMHCAIEHHIMTEKEFIDELKRSGWNDLTIDSVKGLYKLIVKNNIPQN